MSDSSGGRHEPPQIRLLQHGAAYHNDARLCTSRRERGRLEAESRMSKPNDEWRAAGSSAARGRLVTGRV